MSRLTGSDALGLYEAYQAVYNPQELTEEQVWEEVESWVNSLIEEGHDLSDYTWEEMYESYIEEKSAGEFYSTPGKPKPTLAQQQSGTRKALEGGRVVSVASNLGGLRSGTTVKMDSAATRAGGRTVLKAKTQQGAADPEKSIKLGGSSYDRLTTKDGVGYVERKTPTRASVTDVGGNDGGDGGNNPPKRDVIVKAAKGGVPGSLNKTTGKWTSSAPAKVAPKPSAPAAPAAKQTGDKTKDMATFAKANPGLAAAAAERARTRGTSQSDNPLMKGMPGKRPMTPSVQSPTLAKDLGTGSGNQSLVNNPNASKAATPKKPIAAGFDMFDVVKGYLIGEGYADTEEAALVIMTNMSEEWRESIVERGIPNLSIFGGNSRKPVQTSSTPKEPTVASPGGKGGKVTVNKSYPATLNKEKGVKSYGPTGTEYFTPNISGTNIPDTGRHKFKSVASKEYERVPNSKGDLTPKVDDSTKFDPAYKPISMRKPGNFKY